MCFQVTSALVGPLDEREQIRQADPAKMVPRPPDRRRLFHAVALMSVVGSVADAIHGGMSPIGDGGYTRRRLPSAGP